MAISKLILNGQVQMDVTSNTNTANNMLSGVVGTKNDGTSVTGSIATKTSSDLTASGATVTAPAGYYSTAATKSIGAGSAFPPAVTITKAPTIGVNTSGVVTASYNGSSSITPTVNAGYISQGTAGTISTTGTSTYQLTSKAAATYYPSTADQTIASQRWLVGNQTIKSVTTSNLTAANIAEGVTVKVGDSSNASRITQVTGTHNGATSYTATICGWSGTNGNANYCYVMYGGVKKYTIGDTFTFKAGDTLTIYDRGNEIYINGLGVETSNYTYTYILPDNDTDIHMYYDNSTECCVSVKNKIPEDNIIFRSHWDNASQSDVYTCNKTYDECYALFESGRGAHAYYEQTTSIDFFLTGVIKKDGLRYRFYENYSGDDARGQFYYYPDNTIIYTDNPYHTIAFINITSNGTYSSASTYYHEINVSVQGDGYTVDQIAMRTISGSISGSATTIGSYAFYYCSALTTASFPSATHISADAFAFCYSLTTISFPNVTSIGTYAFNSCSALTTASFPNVTSIGDSAFNYCLSLTTASFPSATIIGSYAFNSCYSLTTASFPNVTSIGNYAFRYCSSLTTASFPNVTSIGGNAFNTCTSLTTVSFPNVTSIGGNAFNTCTSLTTVSFPSAMYIGASAFRGCHKLLSLYLIGSSIPTLGANAFSYSPIDGYTTSTGGVYGSIFVPASLYSSYITATGWSVYSSRIVSVQGGVILNYSGATTAIQDGISGYDTSIGYGGRLIGPLSWNATPIVGMTYQVNMAFYRQRNNRTYSFTGEIEWNGYGSTKITLTNINTIDAFPEAEQLTVVVSNVDDDIIGDTYSITIEL